MAIAHSFIQELLSRVDIVDVVGRYVQLKKAGANMQGLCPFHTEKSPSFSVSPSKQFYHCFGCGKSGDAITFLMEHAGMSFVEAVQELAGQHGLQVPDERSSPQERARAEAQRKQRMSLHDVLEKAAADYRKQLKNAPAAISYLKNRGLSGAIAARFGLGYAPNSKAHLSSVFADYTDTLLQEAGLVAHKEDRHYDYFRDRIMFPIRNVKGEHIGFGGRVLGDGKPKYLNSPETPVFSKGQELYGLFEARDAIRKSGFALVTEGYMDVVALAQLGFANTVATLGTACTPDHIRKLFRFTQSVVFSFDGDNAGRNAARKALEAALPHVDDRRSIKFLFLPAEHDPDSYVRAFGSNAFSEQINQAMPLSNFIIEVASHDCDLNQAEGRARMASQAAPLWQTLPQGMFKRQLLDELAKLVRIPANELLMLWGNSATTQVQPHQIQPHAQKRNPQSKAQNASTPYKRREDKPALQQAWARPTGMRGDRTVLHTQADHALRYLLTNTQSWDILPPAAQEVLLQQPWPYGAFFAWIERQYMQNGAQPWSVLQMALRDPQHAELQALAEKLMQSDHRLVTQTASEFLQNVQALQVQQLKQQQALAFAQNNIEQATQLGKQLAQIQQSMQQQRQPANKA